MYELVFDPTNTETLEQMRRIPAFSALDERLITEVVRASKLRKYASGEFVIKEGMYDHWVYFLIQGELSITHHGVEVGQLRRLGDVFGEMGIIDGSARSASVEALSPCLCLAMDGSILESPNIEKTALQAIFYRVFCEILATRLREMDTRLAELSQRDG
jgi:CRP-like cAMP-binding protein